MWKINLVCEKWSEEACEFVRRTLDKKYSSFFDAVDRDIPISSALLRAVAITPEEMIEVPNNLLLNAGIQRMEDLMIGAGGTAFNNANSRLGVGNSATAEAATQTDLQAAAGAANRQFKVMNATFPSRSSQTVTWQSDYTSGEANFVWNEWGVDNGTTSGTTVTAPMLNRKVASLGTKATGTWTLTATLTIA